MVLNKLGPSAAAFYYIDMMIVNLLYVIPFASAQSLFAEGSYDEAKLISHAKKAAKLNLLLIGPASLVLLLAGHFVLSVYGHTYASDGTILLQILVLSAVFVTANYIYAAMFKVTQGKLAIIIMSALGATSFL